MNINIQEIVDNKIKSMNDDGTIKNAIEKTIENTILKSITDALSDYSLRRTIEEHVSKQVSSIVTDIGFTAYNSFIAEKVKQITEDVCRADITEKIQKTFNDILILKRDSIKLSEIFAKYREWICNEVDEPEKYDLENFHVKFEENEKYRWIDVELAKEKPDNKYSYVHKDGIIHFILHRSYDNKNVGWIGSLYINGYEMNKQLNFRHLTNVEALLLNLVYNRTPIEIDIESEDDIDNSFDVDI